MYRPVPTLVISWLLHKSSYSTEHDLRVSGSEVSGNAHQHMAWLFDDGCLYRLAEEGERGGILVVYVGVSCVT